MLRLGLAFLHKRDACSAVRHAVAIENGQVHQRVVENMRHDSGERLSAVNVRKAIVAGKARRREPDHAAYSRKYLAMDASYPMKFRMLRRYSGAGNDFLVPPGRRKDCGRH